MTELTFVLTFLVLAISVFGGSYAISEGHPWLALICGIGMTSAVAVVFCLGQ